MTDVDNSTTERKATTKDLRRHWKEELASLSDRATDIRAPLNRLLDAWSFDLSSRKPGVAYVDDSGAAVTTLDLACFLSALADARAVVNLPEYQVRRAKTVTEGQMVVSNKNRHGRIISLSSNQDAFSFGFVCEDANVIDDQGNVGLPRTYLMQDIDGQWYEGWKSVDLLPTGLPGEVFQKLAGALSTLVFQYFIHPNRWPSFYGVPHLLALAADQRISDQLRFLKTESKRLKEILNIEPKVWPKTSKIGDEEKIKIWAMNVELDGFNLIGEYKQYPDTQDGLDSCNILSARLRAQQKNLRFQMRATAFAFYNEAIKPNIPEDKFLDWQKGEIAELQTLQPRKSGWVVDKQWETGWKEKPKSRTFWARMEIKEGYHVRFKLREKTESVSGPDEWEKRVRGVMTE